MNFILSTPSRYVDALKKENVAWPTKTGDFLNEDRSDDIDQGAFSSGASMKKQIKDASGQYYALSKTFARKVIDNKVSQEEAAKYVKTSEALLDQISVM